MSVDDFRRIFAMSAFEGLRVLRLRKPMYPQMSLPELSDFIRRVDGAGASHDYEAAFVLETVVAPVSAPADALGFYQDCIENVIPAFRPIWGRIIPYGRQKFVQKLSQDEEQCFRAAGLLEHPPTASIISWWDRVAARARLQADQDKMIRAREAERLSLEYEEKRLAALNINASPVWMSIEDNTAGYDIQSFDVGVSEPVSRLIEVKSTIASPLRFYVSRNEWDTARKYGASYLFHVWDLRGPQLFERTVSDIAAHIPIDEGHGKWQTAIIPITSRTG